MRPPDDNDGRRFRRFFRQYAAGRRLAMASLIGYFPAHEFSVEA
jgi:hypothetical protein